MKNKKEKKNVKNMTNNYTFKGATVALQVFIDEYSKELERKNFLENKVIALVTIQMAILTVFMPIIPFDKIILGLRCTNNTEIIITTIACMALLFSVITIITSFVILLSAVKIQTYKKVDIEQLNLDSNLKQDQNAVERGLCNHYAKITLENAQLNAEKANKFKLGLPLTIASFACIIMGTILLRV